MDIMIEKTIAVKWYANAFEHSYRLYQDELCANNFLPLKVVKKNLDKPWLGHWVSEKKSLTMKKIKANPDMYWNWYSLSGKKIATMEDINDNLDKLLNWAWISINPLITWKDVTNNPYHPWNSNELSKNLSLTWTNVSENIEKPWNWHNIYYNSTIIKDMFKKKITYEKIEQIIEQNKILTERQKLKLKKKIKNMIVMTNGKA